MQVKEGTMSRGHHTKKKQLTYGKTTRKVVFGHWASPTEVDSGSDAEQAGSGAELLERVIARKAASHLQGHGKTQRSPTSSSNSELDIEPTSLKRASPFLDRPVYSKKRKTKDRTSDFKEKAPKKHGRQDSGSWADDPSKVHNTGSLTITVPRRTNSRDKRARDFVCSSKLDAVISADSSFKDNAQDIPDDPPNSRVAERARIVDNISISRLERTPSPLKSISQDQLRPSTEQRSARITSPSQLGIPGLRISSGTQPRNSSTTPRKARRKSREIEFVKMLSPSKAKLKDRLMNSTNPTEDRRILLGDERDGEMSCSRISQVAEKPHGIDDHSILGAATDKIHVRSGNLESVAVPSQHWGSKVTYTAPHRTILQEEDDDAFLLESDCFEDQTFATGKNGTRRLPNLAPSIPRQDIFDAVDDNLDEAQTSSMRSLHELKEAGVSQRLNKQTEALLDDIEQSNSAAERRSALFELILKVQSPGFLRQFLDAGSEMRLVSFLESCSDEITKFLLCSLMFLIIGNSSSSMLFSEPAHTKVLHFLETLIDCKDDIFVVAKDRRNNVSRDCQGEIKKLCEYLRLSSIWTTKSPSKISLQGIALHCLDYLVRNSRKGGSEEELLSKGGVEKLLNVLLSSNNGRESNTEMPAPEASLALSILESSALVYSITNKDCNRLWTTQFIDRLTTFSTNLQERPKTEEHGQLLTLNLRLCLNLSNSNPSICAMFSRVDFVTATLQTVKKLFGLLSPRNLSYNQDLLLDNLVLSLGFLINISEKGGNAQQLFLVNRKGTSGPLETLLDIFKSRLADAFEVTSEEQTKFNVPFGYLAVLLAYLCKNPVIKARVRMQLEGASIKQLLDAVGEFLRYHRKLEEIRLVYGDADVKANFIGRLQDLLNFLKESEDLT